MLKSILFNSLFRIHFDVAICNFILIIIFLLTIISLITIMLSKARLKRWRVENKIRTVKKLTFEINKAMLNAGFSRQERKQTNSEIIKRSAATASFVHKTQKAFKK